jgi:hypothetical protein
MDTQAQPQVKVGDILKVTNVGTKLFRGAWDLVDYVIPPGSSDYLPFEIICVCFGDPRSSATVRSHRDARGIVGFLPDRQSEVRRLRLLYSHGFGDFTGKEGVDVVWEADKIPHVEVETLQGQRVFTVLDDPAGSSVIPALTSQADEDRLRAVVEEQGRLIRSLMDRMNMSSVSDLANPEINFPEPNTGKNMWNPETDEIEFVPDDASDREPEIVDDLPEDR